MKRVCSINIAIVLIIMIISICGLTACSAQNNVESQTPISTEEETSSDENNADLYDEGSSEPKNDNTVTVNNDNEDTVTTVDIFGEIGEYYNFGTYEQDGNSDNGAEPIEWLILDKQPGRVLLLSRYALDNKCYDEGKEDVTWETCSLRKWLNNEFYQTAFAPSEQTAIAKSHLENKDTLLRAEQINGGMGGNDTVDKIFLLSIDEVNTYFKETSHNGLVYCEEYVCYPTQYAINNGVNYLTEELYIENYKGQQGQQYPKDIITGSCTWILRSAGFDNAYCADVGDNLTLNDSGNSVTFKAAIRPAIWVNTN